MTTGDKQYCVAHISRLPYVRRLLEELNRRAAEVEAATGKRNWRVATPLSGQARELVDQIAIHGAVSVARLGREMSIPKRTTESFVRALEAAGVVEILELGSRRGVLRRVVTVRVPCLQ
jgi:hypothetical protein